MQKIYGGMLDEVSTVWEPMPTFCDAARLFNKTETPPLRELYTLCVFCACGIRKYCDKLRINKMVNTMKNYVATDRLNPNAVNVRYGRPPSNEQVVAETFSASSDEEALTIFDQMIEAGFVGYSPRNPQRVDATLWRSKEWYGKREKPIFPIG